ncbi:MAG: TlpA family protein disulfide reductase [bacterium]|nr:TlpA family protein disulfide reductase [bacterium]
MGSREKLNWWLVAIIVVMGVEILYLVAQNHRLQAMLDDPLQFMQTLQPDQSVPAIRGQDIAGSDVSLQYGPDQPYTLLTWFSASCSACKGNFGYWNELYGKYGSERMRMIGFCGGTLEEARATAQEQAISYPVMSVTDQFLVEAYKGNLLPQTVLINPTGQVTQVWPGELTLSMLEQIDAQLAGLVSHADKGGDL